ncbi:hypothetical protein C8J57DRAFT_1017310, partial [Mycena rebaudengoi]
PPEITTEIFELCLHPQWNATLQYAPLLLCCICTAWRTLALATPSLWCSLAYPTCLEELLLWVKRSGNRPLAHRLSSLALSDASGLIHSFPSFSHRWVELELRLSDMGFQTMQATAQTKFPNLRKLTIARIMGPRRLTKGELQPIFNIDEAPQLREVQLELRPSMLVALPWQQLTSLEI